MRWLAILVGLVVAAGCTRLGIWQLHRLGERRALNARLEARLALPALELESGVLKPPPDSLAYRRAIAHGVFAFADQVVEGGRSFQGAPGVHVVTPLRLPDGTGVLVVRGWSYAPDAFTADLAALTEPESTTVTGVLLPPSGWGGVHPESLAVGYPLLPLLLRRVEPVPGQPRALRAVPLPPRSDGPHLSYAVQWFAFAGIAAVGGVILARRRPPSEGTRSAPR